MPRSMQSYPTVPIAVGVEVGPRQVVAGGGRHHRGHAVGRVEVSTHDTDDPVGVVHDAVVEAAEQRRGAAGTRYGGSCSAPPAWSTRPPVTSSFAFDLPQWHRGLLATLRTDLDRPVTFENDVNLAAVAEAHVRGGPRGGRLRAGLDRPRAWVSPSCSAAGCTAARPARPARSATSRSPAQPVADDNRTGKLGGLTGSFQQHRERRDRPRPGPGGTASAAATAADTLRAVIAAGARGEPVLDELARRVAIGVVSVCVVLDPSLVVLAGEVGQAGGEALAGRVREEVTAIAPVSPRVVATGVGTDAVLTGALLTGVAATREELFTAMHD